MLTYFGECVLAYGDNPDRLCAWDGEPLTGRRRRWCSDACGRAWLDNHGWTSARVAALTRDGGCVHCGSRQRLEVDHIVAARGTHAVNSCAHHLAGLRTLCHDCHARRTALQRRGYTGAHIPPPARQGMLVGADSG